ncbi:DUF4832 domain-containing protein [Ideonella sp. DXS29W]|uniref:DUF4832 domain-containing protein n=1 Tax=Ideonella lacteola TaxID=2984193 RepID=A0ABU9BV47_9BURK
MTPRRSSKPSVTALAFAAACALATPLALAASVSATFSPTSADLPNPDRGFYSWAGSDLITDFDIGSVKAGYARGQRLVHAPVSLAAYRQTDIPASVLTTLGSRLEAIRAEGMKAELLVAYDFTAGGNDATASQIARHLAQLKPVLAAHAEVIPYMRAGFIGAWGEWHSSKSGNSCGYHSGDTSCDTADANRLIVRDALLANVPATTQIAFRYPGDLKLWYPDVNAPKQVASHNDCFLAGPTDSGTYPSPDLRTYIQELTRKASFGGETCENADTPVRSSCADILKEGPQYHLAWLNADYAPSVLNTWKSEGCYSTVSAQMGYRIQLDRLNHPGKIKQGGNLTVHVDLRNVGWARMFVDRALEVRLTHRSSGEVLTGRGGKLSKLAAQATGSSRFDVSVPIPADAPAGTYDVSLAAPDAFAKNGGDVRFAVRFANADRAADGQQWHAADASFSTGTAVKVVKPAAR